MTILFQALVILSWLYAALLGIDLLFCWLQRG